MLVETKANLLELVKLLEEKVEALKPGSVVTELKDSFQSFLQDIESKIINPTEEEMEVRLNHLIAERKALLSMASNEFLKVKQEVIAEVRKVESAVTSEAAKIEAEIKAKL